jgi:hypothetical protein
MTHAKQPVRMRRQANPHRLGISPALGLCAGDDALSLILQTDREKECNMIRTPGPSFSVAPTARQPSHAG